MEVTVTDYQNLPESTVVSVRFGATRRQAPLGTAKEHPLKFPSSLEDVHEPLKIDVLQPIASARLVLHEFAETYQIGFDGPLNDESQGNPLLPKDIAIGLNVAPSGKSKPIRGDASAQQTATPFKFQDAAASAREYLETHGLLRYVQALLHAVIQVRPDDPFAFMVKQLSAPQSKASPAPAPARPTETVPRHMPKAAEPQRSLDPCKECTDEEPAWGTPAANAMLPPESRTTLPPVKPPARKEPAVAFTSAETAYPPVAATAPRGEEAALEPPPLTPFGVKEDAAPAGAEETDLAAEGGRPKAAAPLPAIDPVPTESREDAVARLKVEMGGEKAVRVCVMGSALFQGLKSQELTRLIGKTLSAQVGLNAEIRFVTAGMPGVQETLVKELWDVNPVYNLVPFGTDSHFQHGQTCYGGMDRYERREIYSLVGDIYVLIEGGPKSAEGIRSAHARGASVLPVPRTGGAAKGMFDLPQEVLARPEYASEEEWALLSDAEAPIEESAEAAAALLVRLIDGCRRRAVRENKTSVGVVAPAAQPDGSLSTTQEESAAAPGGEAPTAASPAAGDNASEPRSPAAAGAPAAEASPDTCVLPAISAAPVPTETPEEAAARLRREMGGSGAVRVCISGSPFFRSVDTQQLTWLIGKALGDQLPEKEVVYVTGGMPGVQETLVKAVKDGSQVCNLVPYGHDCRYGHGRTCYGGRTLQERAEIFGLVGDIYLLIAGGPTAAAEARSAHARGARVLPVPRSGGVASVTQGRNSMPPEVVQKPECIPADTWALLSDTAASCELTASAVASVLRVFVSQGIAASAQLALRREVGETLVGGTLDGRLPSVLHTIKTQRLDATEEAAAAVEAERSAAPAEAAAQTADMDALIRLYRRKAIETLAEATADGRLQEALVQLAPAATISASSPSPPSAPPESLGVAATDDHQAAPAAQPDVVPSITEDLFNALDADGDGVISREELSAAWHGEAQAAAAADADARAVTAVRQRMRALLEEAVDSGELASAVNLALMGPAQAARRTSLWTIRRFYSGELANAVNLALMGPEQAKTKPAPSPECGSGTAWSPADEQKEAADSTQDIHMVKERLRQTLEHSSTSGRLADVLEDVMAEPEQPSIKELRSRTRDLFENALECGALEAKLRDMSGSLVGQADHGPSTAAPVLSEEEEEAAELKAGLKAMLIRANQSGELVELLQSRPGQAAEQPAAEPADRRQPAEILSANSANLDDLRMRLRSELQREASRVQSGSLDTVFQKLLGVPVDITEEPAVEVYPKQPAVTPAAEAQAALAAQGSPEVASDLFGQWDKNGDGYISREEFTEAMQEQAASSSAPAAAAAGSSCAPASASSSSALPSAVVGPPLPPKRTASESSRSAVSSTVPKDLTGMYEKLLRHIKSIEGENQQLSAAVSSLATDMETLTRNSSAILKKIDGEDK